MLTTKLETTNLVATQNAPQRLFSVGHFFAECPLKVVGLYLFVCLTDQNLPHPHPNPPLEGEGIYNVQIYSSILEHE